MDVEPPDVPASVVEGSVVVDRLAELRDAGTDHPAFRAALSELGHAVNAEVGTTPRTVETPLATAPSGQKVVDPGAPPPGVRRVAFDLLRDGVLAPLLTLGAGYALARAVLLPFSVVAFLLTMLAAALWFVGLGGFRDSPADEPRGPPAWRAALAAPERWPEFLSPTRRALVYGAGLFVLGWVAIALAPSL